MVPDKLKYTKEHEWVDVDGDIAIVGITDYAQGELGDIVYVELSNVGEKVTQFESMGTIEAVKAVSDIYAPLSGEVVEVNAVLETAPEVVNRDPYGDGWFIKIKLDDIAEIDNLISPQEYKELIGE
ncbi:glycine cleavage system protein GcvH [bacterium]|nr:MAG: glycine cleavage system protein GcvH [bacterium]